MGHRFPLKVFQSIFFSRFNEMQRKKSHYLIGPTSPEKKSTINQYFTTTSCVVCGVHTQNRICQRCSSSKHLQNTTITLIEKLKGWEQNYHNCIRVNIFLLNWHRGRLWSFHVVLGNNCDVSDLPIVHTLPGRYMLRVIRLSRTLQKGPNKSRSQTGILCKRYNTTWDVILMIYF